MPSTSHSIITGDARRMAGVADGGVQLVVTSPPYWQLKDYGEARQIGFNQQYEEYINHLNLVWAECHRALASGCRLCINIGEQFARAAYYGRYKVIPIQSEIIKFCEAVGFDYMGAIIWQKQLTMNASGGGAVMGSYPYPRNGIVKLDYESILLFKKRGTAKPASAAAKAQSKLTREEWNAYFSGHWHFAGVKQDKHIAMFPPELPRRLIKMFSFVGETVLDPFVGSGTTSQAAARLQRNSVGYEINPQYRPIIRNKLGGGDLLAPAELSFSDEEAATPEYCRRAIAKLPYRFVDTVQITRKVDPKRQTFGSKLDAGGGDRNDDFYRVRDIIAPDTLRLNDGSTIKLLGITPVGSRRAGAISYLREKTDGQRVVVKSGDANGAATIDAHGNRLCYLYLANKTFVNAHLIKAGFAVADQGIAHRHRERFIRYQTQAGNG